MTKRKVNFKEIAKNSSFRICHKTQHATHLLKLVDKICKYEMDAANIVDDTQRTRFCPQTDIWTDGQGEASAPPFNFVGGGVQVRVGGGGYNKQGKSEGFDSRDRPSILA